MLHVDLVHEVPEAVKPRKIAIGTGQPETGREKGCLTDLLCSSVNRNAPEPLGGVFVSGRCVQFLRARPE